jgi:hypothetical protein
MSTDVDMWDSEELCNRLENLRIFTVDLLDLGSLQLKERYCFVLPPLSEYVSLQWLSDLGRWKISIKPLNHGRKVLKQGSLKEDTDLHYETE